MHRTTRVVAVAVFLAALWALFQFSGLKAHFSLQAIHDGFEQNMVAGLLVFAALFALGNLAQIPGWLFLVAAVLALGRVWGGLATAGRGKRCWSMGSAVGCTLRWPGSLRGSARPLRWRR